MKIAFWDIVVIVGSALMVMGAFLYWFMDFRVSGCICGLVGVFVAIVGNGKKRSENGYKI